MTADPVPHSSVRDDDQIIEQIPEEIPIPEVIDNVPDNNVGDSEVQLPRRSSRIRNTPQRLNIESTKGQSYSCDARSTCQSVSSSLPSTWTLWGRRASMDMERSTDRDASKQIVVRSRIET